MFQKFSIVCIFIKFKYVCFNFFPLYVYFTNYKIDNNAQQEILESTICKIILITYDTIILHM
jgi:hypothetical protein